jgi:transcriptional regulator with XRE-family HTH domain
MDENLQPRLGMVLRGARERLGLTQAQVAREVGFVTTVYGRIERGDMLPSVPKLYQLCLTLGLSADELLALEPPGGAPMPGSPVRPRNELPELRRIVPLLSELSPDSLQVFRSLVEALFSPRQG